VHFCRTRLGCQPQLAGIKHLNRLEQVLAAAERDAEALDEGLMQDQQGNVVAGTMSNLFVVRGAALLTPPLATCGIAGPVRARLLELAPRLGLEPLEAPLEPDQILRAEEAFLGNSLIGIWSIQHVEDRTLPPASLAPRLCAALREQRAIMPP